jgi:hypothetical protein
LGGRDLLPSHFLLAGAMGKKFNWRFVVETDECSEAMNLSMLGNVGASSVSSSPSSVDSLFRNYPAHSSSGVRMSPSLRGYEMDVSMIDCLPRFATVALMS